MDSNLQPIDKRLRHIGMEKYGRCWIFVVVHETHLTHKMNPGVVGDRRGEAAIFKATEAAGVPVTIRTPGFLFRGYPPSDGDWLPRNPGWLRALSGSGSGQLPGKFLKLFAKELFRE